MGNNSAYTDMEAVVIGLSNSLKDKLTGDIIKATCQMFSRYSDIDSGGSRYLADWKGREMERIVIEYCSPDFDFEALPNVNEGWDWNDPEQIDEWRDYREDDEFDAIMERWYHELGDG